MSLFWGAIPWTPSLRNDEEKGQVLRCDERVGLRVPRPPWLRAKKLQTAYLSRCSLCAGEVVSWKSREHLAWAPLVTIASEKGQIVAGLF